MKTVAQKIEAIEANLANLDRQRAFACHHETIRWCDRMIRREKAKLEKLRALQAAEQERVKVTAESVVQNRLAAATEIAEQIVSAGKRMDELQAMQGLEDFPTDEAFEACDREIVELESAQAKLVAGFKDAISQAFSVHETIAEVIRVRHDAQNGLASFEDVVFAENEDHKVSGALGWVLCGCPNPELVTRVFEFAPAAALVPDIIRKAAAIAFGPGLAARSPDSIEHDFCEEAAELRAAANDQREASEAYGDED